MERYLLGYLHDEFGRHYEESEKNRVRCREGFIQDYPGEPIPDYMVDDFSLPRALGSIVEELIDLRLQVGQLREEVQGWK